MVGKSRQVTIQFLGDSKSFTSATSAMGKSTTSLGDKLKKLGKAAVIGFAGTAVIAGKAMYEMAEAAIEDEKAAALLANTLKNTTGATKKQIASVEDWISKQGELFGVTDDDLRPAISKLAAATGDVAKAQDLASLAMDVAAGRNKTLSQVSEALAKAQAGNIGALGRLGIATKDASGKTKTLAEITDDLSKKYAGSAAKAADTASGKFQRLKVALSETGESIGYKLLPYANDLGDWLLKTGVPALEDAAHQAKHELGPALKDLAEWVGDNKDEFKELGSEVVDVLIPAIRDLGGFVGDAVGVFVKLPGPVRQFGIEAAIVAAVLPKVKGAMTGLGLPAFNSQLDGTSTKMQRLGGAAKSAAGVAGLALLVDGATRADGAVGALETTLGGAATGFAVGGPVGAAVGGFAGLVGGLVLNFESAHDAAEDAYREISKINPVEAAKEKLSDLRDTLNQVTGAYTGATRAAVLQKLQQDGLIDTAAKYGIGARELVNAAIGQKGAMSALAPVVADYNQQLQDLDDQQKAITDSAKNYITVGGGKGVPAQRVMTSAALDQVAALEKQKKGLQTNLEELKQLPGALKASSKQIRENSAATTDYAGKLKGLPKQLVTAITQSGVEPSVRAIADLTKRYNLTPKQVKTLIAASGAETSAKQVQNLVDKINHLHDKTITITTNQRGGVTSSAGGHSATSNRGGVAGNVIQGNFGGKGDLVSATLGINAKQAELAGSNLLISIVKGMKKGERTLHHVMAGLQDYIQSKTDKLNEILSDRSSFVQSFRDAFSESIFSAQFSDAEGNAVPPTLQKMLDFAKQQQANAHALAANIKSLLSKGLSRDLIQQLVSQGQSGFDQIGALASGSASDIQAFNDINADINSTLSGLGTDLYDALNPNAQDQIALLTAQVANGQEQVAHLKKIADTLDKGDKIEIRGSQLVILLRAIERETGRQLLVSHA